MNKTNIELNIYSKKELRDVIYNFARMSEISHQFLEIDIYHDGDYINSVKVNFTDDIVDRDDTVDYIYYKVLDECYKDYHLSDSELKSIKIVCNV